MRLRYSTYDRKFYAIIQALKHWRHYLLHKEFLLFSDHEALKYLHSQRKLSDLHARWVEYMQDFTFVLRHKKGKENVMADALSRQVHLLNLVKVHVTGFESLPESYIDCPDFSRILRALSDGHPETIRTSSWSINVCSLGADCAYHAHPSVTSSLGSVTQVV